MPLLAFGVLVRLFVDDDGNWYLPPVMRTKVLSVDIVEDALLLYLGDVWSQWSC
jgi:hypothetical protein